VSGSRDAEYSEYVAARLSSLRRLAAVLCDDWQRADDLVQATLVKLYVHWGRAQSVSHPDAYARAILVREFIQDRRSNWVRRVSLSSQVDDSPAAVMDHDAVLDLADTARAFDDALGWACAACGGRLTTPQRIAAAMSRRAKLRYRNALRLALDDITAGTHTILEHRYLRNVERAHGLPRAERQVRVVHCGRSQYRDVLYRKYRVAVETDGQVAHPAEGRWRDLHRDNAAAADGIITLRYNWSDVTTRPCAVAAEVAAVLAHRGWPGPPRPCGPACTLRSP
jgi:DNA-directed RNA polymerase specialized sigma24 family protein